VNKPQRASSSLERTSVHLRTTALLRLQYCNTLRSGQWNSCVSAAAINDENFLIT
jgi:hypothetical protein